MKRIHTFAAALLLSGACSPDGFTIRGNIEGLEAPYVYLMTFDGKPVVVDSARVEAGAFAFAGKTERPEVAYLSLDKEQPLVRFFLENAAIGIGGNVYNANEVFPTGTPSNEAMNAFNELTYDTGEAYNVTELESDRERLVDDYKQRMRKLIRRNRNNICGMIVLAETGSMFFTPEEVLDEIGRFPAEWRQRPELTDLRRVMEHRLRTAVGQPYTDIVAPTPTEHPYRCAPWWRIPPTATSSSTSGLRGAAPPDGSPFCKTSTTPTANVAFRSMPCRSTPNAKRGRPASPPRSRNGSRSAISTPSTAPPPSTTPWRASRPMS